MQAQPRAGGSGDRCRDRNCFVKVASRLCEVARKELACAREVTGKGVRVALLGNRRRSLLGSGERVTSEHRDDLGAHPRRVKPRYAGVPALVGRDPLKPLPPPRLIGANLKRLEGEPTAVSPAGLVAGTENS